jgi:uncharacterized coiled-coil protein SlyX
VATPDDRFLQLEERIAHQDRVIADLDAVVREFALRVERLERALGELREGGAPEFGPADEKPPHY